jgi:LmbE family N-acetylglucosaminyl deacetylase
MGSASRYPIRAYFEVLTQRGRPVVLQAPPRASSVVILAPHPDDETIGCGGTASHYAHAGSKVTVVFISDGDAGSPELRSILGTNAEGKARLAATRRIEAERAVQRLGVSEFFFLGLPDGDIRPTRESVQALAAVLSDVRPELVFLPFLGEQHPDHFRTNSLFLEASYSLNGSALECWGYEVWTPLPANRVINITETAQVKWDALREYKSQLMHVDYLSTVQGLNAFRWSAAFKPEAGYAEAFHACSLKDYAELYRRVVTGGSMN